jgi:hypothetical protein
MNSFDFNDTVFDLPDLDTVVGLYGSAAREEVAGASCVAILLGTIVAGG